MTPLIAVLISLLLSLALRALMGSAVTTFTLVGTSLISGALLALLAYPTKRGRITQAVVDLRSPALTPATDGYTVTLVRLPLLNAVTDYLALRGIWYSYSLALGERSAPDGIYRLVTRESVWVGYERSRFEC